MSQKNFHKALLTALLAIIWGPIIYLGYQDYAFKETIFQDEDELNIAAQRYIKSGQWPSSREESKLISEFEKFVIPKDKDNKESSTNSKSVVSKNDNN
ncbi:hypothetical protein QWY77_03020 [Thalassotalea ponticola]|uniref:hypothetical protein n=1 Tax=Thalassotalea ponticola TaxID=1523392 RepID=UPI0025B5D466|nr:hypothetical protein [Thalassotalea ponticola]MDN3651736.1 hypothetical protein [Thalassotalea ponticola]